MLFDPTKHRSNLDEEVNIHNATISDKPQKRKMLKCLFLVLF